jgi:hypothetical protein
MGNIVWPDQALSHDILKEVMLILEDEWARVHERKRLEVALEGMFCILEFTLALRGEEIPLMELKGIMKHWDQGQRHTTPHDVIALLGRFKTELGKCYHLMPVLVTTPRGLEPRKWVGRVTNEYQKRGVNSG